MSEIKRLKIHFPDLASLKEASSFLEASVINEKRLFLSVEDAPEELLAEAAALGGVTSTDRKY